MTQHGEDLRERVAAVENKIESLAATMNERFEGLDRRFDDVTEAFAEQHRYTDFAYERLDRRILQVESTLGDRITALEAKVHSGFSRLDRKLDQLIDRA